MMKSQILRRSMLASAISLACTAHVIAGDITVVTGSTETSSKSVGGTDHVVVDAGGIWSVDDTAIKWKDPSTPLVIDNAGLIESTAEGGRAINASGDDTGSHYLVLNNATGATIQSQSDAFRINTDFSDGQVVVNNAGTIHSTVDGQALDFDAVTSTGTGAIVINNLAGGVIRADGADAIRPGEGGTVNNAGTIYSDGIIGDSNDGIDFQAHAGSVTNLPGGLISGQRHGITSDVDVNVFNAAGATIIGRNGSGVGSDGTGTVVNYGTITGAYVGTGDGDGDGVDIDFHGDVENWGIIEGTGAGGIGKDGQINASEGVSVTGGGTITNHAGAIIRGVITGVTAYGAQTIVDGQTKFGTFSVVNDGEIYGSYSGASLIGGITLSNSGSIRSDNVAILIGPGSTASIENAGTITGTNGAILFAEGNDTLLIDQGSSITGSVDGGTGYDTLWLRGGSFDTAENFEELDVSGTASLTGNNNFQSVRIAGNLQIGNGGTTGSVGGASIVDNGSLSIDRSDSVVIPNAISGTGRFRQIGSGTTVLTGSNTYMGTTSVEAGTLIIGDAGAGSVNGDAVVLDGGILRGSGKVGGDLTVFAGGALYAGSPNSSGPLSVSGNVIFHDGAIYDFDAAGGTLLAGGRLAIGNDSILNVENAGVLKPNIAYPIIFAAGGLGGQFSEARVLNTDYVFLTPTLSYTANSAAFSVRRNSLAMDTIAGTHDERTTADALDALDVDSPLASSVLAMNATSARSAFDQLSGQQYASTRASLVDSAHNVRDGVTRHLLGTNVSADEGEPAEHAGLAAWTSAWGHNGDNSRGDASRLSSEGGGVLVGADVRLGNGRLGVMVGRGSDQDDVRSQDSSSRARSNYFGIYGDASWGGWQFRGGISYAWQDIDVSRQLILTGVTSSRLSSHYGANVAQAFAEYGYRFDLSPRQWLEPFIGGARVRLHTDRASEGDAFGALDVSSGDTSINTASLGIRHASNLGRSGNIQAHASLALNRSSGDLNSASTQRFVGATLDFSVRGTPIARSATALDAGLTFSLSPRTSVDASYTGQFASHARDQGARLQLAVQL
jgi:autotransporter-associated beta strand protein